MPARPTLILEGPDNLNISIPAVSFNRTLIPYFSSGLTSQLLERGLRNPRNMLTLEQLLKNVPVTSAEGGRRLGVRQLCTDSRRVTPGAVFFALPGRRTRGTFFVEEAIDRGAVAVITEESIWVPRNVARVVVSDVREALVQIARRFYGYPERDLKLFGISGTAGKTVVASLLRYLLEEDGAVGLLGTINYSLGKRTLPAYRTTPEPVDLYAMLAQMRDGGCRKAVLEISSHGIDQGRVSKLNFDTLAFLNLSTQHLDYHGSMDAYFDTILKAFDGRNGAMPRSAVINLSDAYGARLEKVLGPEIATVTFGFNSGATIWADEVECLPTQTRFVLHHGESSWQVVSNLIGELNVSNTLAALALGFSAGLSFESMIRRLFDFEGVRGRMERIDQGQPYNVVVDYMHTPEAYQAGLATLRSLTSGRLITVFGCGGDRDRSQRPVITETVARNSDLVFATADNPRSEELEQIFEDMKRGVRVGDSVHFLENRRHAISLALDSAEPGDTVLIAGKGHETYQEYADSVMPFDDRAVVRDLIKKKGDRVS